jgi:hypothetical protein
MKNIKTTLKTKKVVYCLIVILVIFGGGVTLWQYPRVFGQNPSSNRERLDRIDKQRVVHDYYLNEIEDARAQGKKELILPAGVATPLPELSLEELLNKYSLLRVKVLDKETTVDESGADIQTWFKLEILETLQKQEKIRDKPLRDEMPSRLLPLLPSESLLVVQGGLINVDGITVVRKVCIDEVMYRLNEEYIIVGDLDYGGKVITPASGAAGVFQVRNSILKSFGPERHRLVREIKDKFGDDLAYLRADVQLRRLKQAK